MTPIRFSPSSLRQGRWYEYVVRFALGGATTAFTGLISSRYGAAVGGLFLALPAIFCASATLRFAGSSKRGSPANGAGRWPLRSTLLALRSAHSDYWHSREHFHRWWQSTSRLLLSPPRLPG